MDLPEEAMLSKQ